MDIYRFFASLNLFLEKSSHQENGNLGNKIEKILHLWDFWGVFSVDLQSLRNGSPAEVVGRPNLGLKLRMGEALLG